MRKNSFLRALLIGIASVAYSTTKDPVPVTDFGSNPYFSTRLYPQDLLLRPGCYLSYSPSYYNGPYWGDVDEPVKKPNTRTDYTITGIDIKDEDGTFRNFAAVHSISNDFGYVHRFNETLIGNLDIDYDLDIRNNVIQGDMTGDSIYSIAAGGRLPLFYESNHTLNRLDVKAAFGSLFRNKPFGIQLNGGFNNTLALNHRITFKKLAKTDSIHYESGNYKNFDFTGEEARLLWGATTVGCSHPFALRGTQGDMWKQDEYDVGPIYFINLNGGATLPRVKSGFDFRYIWGHQIHYRWRTDYSRFSRSDSLDMTLSENFIGRYVKDNRARVTRAGEGSVFGNIVWREGERFALKTFGAIRYSDSISAMAPLKNLRVLDIGKERIRTLILDAYPNMSVNFGGALNYFDAALLFRYRYSRYGNFERPGVYNRTTCYGGWEEYYEDCSYSNENSLDLGADCATMFPLFTSGPHNLSLNLRMLGDVRFTIQKKYYGGNDAGLKFNVENIRKNLSRELMFNTSLMLHYIKAPYHLRLQFTQPMLYSIAPFTKVTDSKGNVVNDGNNYPLKKSALWITRNSFNVSVYASYDYVLPFLPH